MKKQSAVFTCVGFAIFVLTWIELNYPAEMNCVKEKVTEEKNITKVPISYKDEVAFMIEQLHLPETSGCNQIPRRIHQLWNTEMIPGSFASYVSTWKTFHPDWEYWFWTAKTMDEFISRRFPKYILLFRGYQMYMHRADAMRYFILYEFGGLYVDLDVSALRRWDEQLTRSHTMLIPEDHEAHTVLLHNMESITLSAIIMAAPRHSFFAYVIHSLADYDKKTKSGDYLGKAGPVMVSKCLEEYVENRNKSGASICDAVFVPYHDRFNPNFDRAAAWTLRQKCNIVFQNANNDRRKRICSYLRDNNYSNKPLPDAAYTNHAFVHAYLNSFRDKTRRHIKTVVGDMYVNVTERYLNLDGPNRDIDLIA